MSTMIPTTELLVERACEQTGLSDLGPDGWQAGLDRLVAAVCTDVGDDHDAVTRIQTQIVNRLVHRLRVEDWYAAHGAEAAKPIEGPLVILGMPRTATTALHYLLSVDPQFRYPRNWELADLVPPPDLASEQEDPRRPSATGESDVQHIRTADGPAEDRVIHEMAFQNGETVLPVPSYTRWWRDADHTTLFSYQERILRLLHSHRPPYHWLLKLPAYMFELRELAAHYPHARFVMTHRDPVAVVPSTCSTVLTSRLRRLPNWDTDLTKLGDEVLEHWVDGVRRAMAARAELGEDRFIDMGQHEVDTDPIGTAERIYDFAGLVLDDKVRAAMERFAADNRRGAHGAHRYRAADFGVEPEAIRQAFADYLATFGRFCTPAA